jgi:GAF domain-containing protein/HAMP domain-containing protein
MSKLAPTPPAPQLTKSSADHADESHQLKQVSWTRRLGFQIALMYLLMVLLPLGVLIAGFYSLSHNLWVVGVFGVIFLILIPLGLAKEISNKTSLPIAQMTEAAREVVAGGQWENTPEGRDETGQLAQALNEMTGAQSLILDELKQDKEALASKLAQASELLTYQTAQLHTVAEVASAIASVLDPDLLLQRVTELISERYPFYHVAIYLLDRKAENLVLQAASSEVGQQMIAQGHRLKVNQDSLAGSVTLQDEARLVNQEEAEAAGFTNPDFPDSRAELAIPLKAADKVIGVLDAHLNEPSALIEEDIPLLSTIADQIAVAIENVRLYTETRQALAELEATHRYYLREKWSRLVEERREKGYLYQHGKLGALAGGDATEEQLAGEGQSGQLVLEESSQLPEGTLPGEEILAPITVRGQWIGSLKLGEKGHIRQWSEEDIHLIRAVADQVGLALENSRLLEETYLRAEREHLVSEITSKLRASNDPQVILQTAMEELRQVLRTKRTQFVAPDQSTLSQTDGGLSDTGSESSQQVEGI